MLLYGRLERPVRQVLKPQVDAGPKVSAMPGWPDAGHVLDRPAQAVLQHALRSGFTRQPVIEGEFETLLPVVVDIRESDEMPGHLAGGIIPAVFTKRVHARQPKCDDPLGSVRAEVPLQIQEFLVHAARNTPHQLVGIDLQHPRQLRNAIDRGREFLRVGPYAVHGSADRERLAVAIRNRSAVR